jgi:hypothetical protein
VVRIDEQARALNVEMYYNLKGQADTPWRAWIHEGRGQHPWTKDIPIDSVCCSNPKFVGANKGGIRAAKQLSAETLDVLGTVKGLGYGYCKGYGLLPWQDLLSTLQQQVDALQGSTLAKDIQQRNLLNLKLKGVKRMQLTVEGVQVHDVQAEAMGIIAQVAFM